MTTIQIDPDRFGPLKAALFNQEPTDLDTGRVSDWVAAPGPVYVPTPMYVSHWALANEAGDLLFTGTVGVGGAWLETDETVTVEPPREATFTPATAEPIQQLLSLVPVSPAQVHDRTTDQQRVQAHGDRELP